ncbi:hypothetical protein [Desulfonatronum parangueonense]
MNRLTISMTTLATPLLLLFFLLSASPVPAASPTVAAATGWAAALARAAGAEDVLVIAPEALQHPPDYDPKPSDLLRLKDADYIILGGFEGFAQRLRDAAGSRARLVEAHLENSPVVIHKEVLRLGELFGTRDKAEQFLLEFDTEYARLNTTLREHFATQGNRAVAQVFMAVWADFAGLELAGTFGPGLLQPGALLRLSAQKPDIVLDNAHMPAGAPIAEAANAALVRVINFPAPGMELLDVFRENARVLMGINPSKDH